LRPHPYEFFVPKPRPKTIEMARKSKARRPEDETDARRIISRQSKTNGAGEKNQASNTPERIER
jgi:hypothetical protein